MHFLSSSTCNVFFFSVFTIMLWSKYHCTLSNCTSFLIFWLPAFFKREMTKVLSCFLLLIYISCGTWLFQPWVIWSSSEYYFTLDWMRQMCGTIIKTLHRMPPSHIGAPGFESQSHLPANAHPGRRQKVAEVVSTKLGDPGWLPSSVAPPTLFSGHVVPSMSAETPPQWLFCSQFL